MNIHMWNELKNIIDDEINEIYKETSRYTYQHIYSYGFVTILAIMKKLECELENISLKEAGYS